MQTYESPGAPVERDAAKMAGGRNGSLRVACFSTFVADKSQQTERHADVRNFLLALRGERVGGESRVPVGDDERVLVSSNSNDSIDWFGEMVAHYLEASGILPPFAIIPVPTPQTTLESSAGPWTSLLAISIASNGITDAEILDVLRWKVPIAAGKEHLPNVSELFVNLAVTRRLDSALPVILVDHLFTTSAKMRACAARLQTYGVEVLMGLCAGRTAAKASHDPFTVVTGNLPPYEPGH